MVENWNMKKFVGLCLVSIGFFLMQGARAEGWRLSLGGSYRTFDEAEFDSFDFVNPHAETGSGFVTGDLRGNDTRLSVVDDALQVDIGDDDADLHKVEFEGDSDSSMDSAVGLILSARRALAMENGVGVELSLATAFMNSDARFAVAGTTENYAGLAPAWGAPKADGSNFGIEVRDWALAAGGQQRVGVNGEVAYDFDVDVFTLGAGVSKEIMILDAICLNMAAGPTVTIANYDISREQTVRFTDPAETVVYSDTEDDDGIDGLLGVYFGVGLGCNVTERLGVQLGARYDYMTELETDFADIGLSGLSGELKLVFFY